MLGRLRFIFFIRKKKKGTNELITKKFNDEWKNRFAEMNVSVTRGMIFHFSATALLLGYRVHHPPTDDQSGPEQRNCSQLWTRCSLHYFGAVSAMPSTLTYWTDICQTHTSRFLFAQIRAIKHWRQLIGRDELAFRLHQDGRKSFALVNDPELEQRQPL